MRSDEEIDREKKVKLRLEVSELPSSGLTFSWKCYVTFATFRLSRLFLRNVRRRFNAVQRESKEDNFFFG